MTTLTDLETHRESCRVCRPWSCCPVAAQMLEQIAHRAGVQLAPTPKKPGDA